MTSRRAFLFGATAALAAPVIVRAESLMKLWVPPALVINPQPYRDVVSLVEMISKVGGTREFYALAHFGQTFVRSRLIDGRLFVDPLDRMPFVNFTGDQR